jgi:predicted enzyme related to lactoylglutathione lyase
MYLSLVVIKTNQLESLRVFYSELGLQFQEEKHGNGPVHFSTAIENTVLEIYPLPKSVSIVDTTTRLGFSVENLDEIFERLKQSGVQVVAEPKGTEWGYSAVVKDPDGRAIELTQKKA